ncbi:MAG: cephalosporin hydroxylase [Moorea sp. SIO3C2]|nr:cephalosporin hydroxylase [Moorena sp. SIO3C2]
MNKQVDTMSDKFGYKSLKEENLPQREMSASDRFIDIDARKDCCDLPSNIWPFLIESSYKQHWKEIPIWKSALEMVIYPMLLYELRPKVVIEIGAFTGGSAVWIADHLQMFEIPCQIYSVDINLAFLDKKSQQDDRITFIEGDVNKIEELFSAKMLSELDHPWLIIEDAHVNVSGILNTFHSHGHAGDYIIIEDTNLECWKYWDENFEDIGDVKSDKIREVSRFLMQYKDTYKIDAFYQDIFGYNGSKSWNSIIKRML